MASEEWVTTRWNLYCYEGLAEVRLSAGGLDYHWDAVSIFDRTIKRVDTASTLEEAMRAAEFLLKDPKSIARIAAEAAARKAAIAKAALARKKVARKRGKQSRSRQEGKKGGR